MSKDSDKKKNRGKENPLSLSLSLLFARSFQLGKLYVVLRVPASDPSMSGLRHVWEPCPRIPGRNLADDALAWLLELFAFPPDQGHKGSKALARLRHTHGGVEGGLQLALAHTHTPQNQTHASIPNIRLHSHIHTLLDFHVLY